MGSARNSAPGGCPNTGRTRSGSSTSDRSNGPCSKTRAGALILAAVSRARKEAVHTSSSSHVGPLVRSVVAFTDPTGALAPVNTAGVRARVSGDCVQAVPFREGAEVKAGGTPAGPR